MRIGDAMGKKYDVTLKATPLTNSGIEPTHPLEEHDAGNLIFLVPLGLEPRRT